MKAKIILSVILAIVIISSISYFLQPTGKIVSEKEVKVGAMLWLSGDYSIFGTSMQRGIEIALDELNQNDIKYKVIFEDEGTINVQKAVEISRKLIDVDGVDVALAPAANEGKSISPIFETSKTPVVILFDSNNEISKGDYMFGIGFSTEDAAKTMAGFAYRNLSIKSISIVYSFDDWSSLISQEFKKEFEALGGKIAFFEGTEIDEKDFRTFITKSKNTDAIYAPLILPHTLIKQSRELGYKGHIISADALDQNQIDAAGNAAEGIYHTSVYVPENEKLRKLVEKYKARYGEKPEILPVVAIGYDVMYVVDAAVREKGIGREQIKEGLYEIKIEGALGNIDFDETGMSPRFERIFVVRNGTAVLIG